MVRSIALFGVMVLVAGCALAVALTSCSCSFVGASEQSAVVGGQLPACNQQWPYMWCTAGMVSCSGSCNSADSGKRCTNNAPNDQIQASDGGIALCAGTSLTQAYCASVEGVQQCVVKNDCICSFAITTSYKCKTKSGDGSTIQKANITSTTNCLTE